jgi:SNF2 family DNA or RNA helicase
VIYPGFFAERSEAAFMKNWCMTKEVQTPMKNGGFMKRRVITGYKKEKLLQFKKKIDPFFISRSTREIAKELPSLVVQQVHVGLTKQQKDKYKEALDGLLTIDQTGEEKETTLLSQLIYCQQIVDHPNLIECEGNSEKLNVLIDLLENSDLSQQKVIVFSRFRKMIDIIEEVFNKRKITNVRITGAEKEQERTRSKTAFSRKDSGIRVCLINEAAKEGMNLQAAETIVFYDTPWTGGDYIQLIGRMIRIGSVHACVRALHLVCKNTIDQRVLQKLSASMAVIEAIVGERLRGEGSDLFEEKVNAKELMDLMLQDRKNWGRRK